MEPLPHVPAYVIGSGIPVLALDVAFVSVMWLLAIVVVAVNARFDEQGRA